MEGVPGTHCRLGWHAVKRDASPRQPCRGYSSSSFSSPPPASAASFERPYRTDDPYVVGLYRWKATAGLLFESGDFQGTSDRDDLRIEGTIDYGVTDRLEIGAHWDAFRFVDPGEDGTGDLTLHAKGFLFEAATRAAPDFAVDIQIKIPTASRRKGLGTGEADVGLHLLWGWNPNPDWRILVRAGRILRGDAPGIRNNFEFGLAVNRVLSEELTGFVEYFFDSNEVRNQRSKHRVGLGLLYDITPRTRWDVRVEGGFTNTTPDLGIGAGVTYRP